MRDKDKWSIEKDKDRWVESMKWIEEAEASEQNIIPCIKTSPLTLLHLYLIYTLRSMLLLCSFRLLVLRSIDPVLLLPCLWCQQLLRGTGSTPGRGWGYWSCGNQGWLWLCDLGRDWVKDKKKRTLGDNQTPLTGRETRKETRWSDFVSVWQGETKREREKGGASPRAMCEVVRVHCRPKQQREEERAWVSLCSHGRGPGGGDAVQPDVSSPPASRWVGWLNSRLSCYPFVSFGNTAWYRKIGDSLLTTHVMLLVVLEYSGEVPSLSKNCLINWKI